MKHKVVIIDDDEDICLLLNRLLSKNGYAIASANDGESALKQLKEESPSLVLCDFKLPDYSGIDMLRKIKILYPKVPVIIITGYSDVKIAVEALKKGAYDYVTKPLYPDEVLLMVSQAIESVNDKVDNKDKSVKNQINSFEIIKGISPQSELIWKHVDLIAPTDMSVIIEGETGTGKEYVARAIHMQSERKEENFVAIDCGSLSDNLAGSELFGHVKGAFTGALRDKKGCFEQAKKGTIFLDEIGNLSYENQMKLLRALQERRVKRIGGEKEIEIDVRVLVATNDSIQELINDGKFREDLFHRLNEFNIELKPLRKRKEDIPIYINHFLKQANFQLNKEIEGFSDSTIKLLINYVWDGNLRELKNVVKRAVLLCNGNIIDDSCLPSLVASGIQLASLDEDKELTLKHAVTKAETEAIKRALERSGNNKSKAAKLLGVDRKTLYNKLDEYHLN